MKKHPLVIRGEKIFRSCIAGLAIPCDKSTIDGSTIRSEKVLKFNRKALRNIGNSKVEKTDSRFVGGEDNMRFPVGKPGSRERVEALILQYASLADDEMSPFTEE